MRKQRKVYDEEFKKEAIRMAGEPGATAIDIERDLGLYLGAISHWKREVEKDPENAFPGHGRMKPLEEENRRLRRELERVKREREILKKAAAYFSRDVLKDTRS
jgi:transposase